MPDDGQRHWYAAYTKPCHEKRVAEHLGVRSVDFFLPLYRSTRRWNNGCTVTLEIPLFPNYVFVHILSRDRLRVLELSSVISIAGNNHEPTPLPDEDIERLRSGLLQVNAEPHPVVSVGERVRIRSGPLKGLHGIVSRRKNQFRVVLTLDLIMKSVAVEICTDDTEPIGKPEPSYRVMAAYAHSSRLFGNERNGRT
jgi:transcription antitermination factor NusG